MASLPKGVSDFTADTFFVRKGAFYLNRSTKKDGKKDKILTSPVWNKILKIWDKLFELIQLEVQCSTN